jgi:hypothetical protein
VSDTSEERSALSLPLMVVSAHIALGFNTWTDSSIDGIWSDHRMLAPELEPGVERPSG